MYYTGCACLHSLPKHFPILFCREQAAGAEPHSVDPPSDPEAAAPIQDLAVFEFGK